tara:strand:+ start:385 stop:1848 length:1464 start_codon:yes stop_codon:yes gene_type:complete
MNDDLEAQFRQIYEEMDYCENPPLAFPKLGGAYDTYSLLIFTKIQGSGTYKNRLYKLASKLTTDFLNQNETSSVMARIPHAELIKQLEYILHSIAHIASVPGKYHYLSISLNKNDYSAPNGQFAMMSYRAMVKLNQLLANTTLKGNDAYTHQKNGHLNPETNKGGHLNPETNKGMRTRLEPTTPFLDILTKAGLVFAGHPTGLGRSRARKYLEKPLLQLRIKKDGGSERVKVPLQRELNADEAILPEVNNVLERLRLDFDLPNYQAYTASWDFRSGKSKLTNKSNVQLYRIFSEQDGAAGRLYGHWVQTCPSKLRQYLTLNGLPSVETDFSSMQLMLLYGVKGEIPPEGDLYCTDKFFIRDRDAVKQVLTKSVGASSRDIAMSAWRKEFKDNPAKLMGKAELYFDTFWEIHSSVYDLLFDGNEIWKELQYLDSVIALRVLKIMHEQNITCIPIHDSFIVQEKYSLQIENAMRSAFQSVFPNIEPRIK